MWLMEKSGAPTNISGLYLTILAEQAGCTSSYSSQGRIDLSSTSHILSQADKSQTLLAMPLASELSAFPTGVEWSCQ